MVMIITAIVLGTSTTFLQIGAKATYGSDARNDACYNAGFADGQSKPYNQTAYNDVAAMARAYYEGFIPGYISEPRERLFFLSEDYWCTYEWR